jgi:hypothetical protein
MQQELTTSGVQYVQDIAGRYGLSQDAVIHMLCAVNQGGGTMAQFCCSELGGGGQWMQGGMTMVGDMFNHNLKSTVDNLCSELSRALVSIQFFPTPKPGTGSQWWPAELGAPFSSGGQNQSQYAVFPNRLAVKHMGVVTIYDTLDHQVGGVSQQQGGNDSLTFSSQYGTLSVSSLPVVNGQKSQQQQDPNFLNPAPMQNEDVSPMNASPITNDMPALPMNDAFLPSTTSSNEVISLLEKLGQLQKAGVLTDQEFQQKKSELLDRI